MSVLLFRQMQEIGDGGALFIEQTFVRQLVRAHHITVIGGEYDDRIFIQPAVFERFEDFSDAVVDLRAESAIGTDELTPTRFGREIADPFSAPLKGFRENSNAKDVVLGEFVVEIFWQVDLLGVVLTGQGAVEGHVGFEIVDVENKGLFLIFFDETAGGLPQKRGFGERLRQVRRRAPGKFVFRQIGLEALFNEPMMIVAPLLLGVIARIVVGIEILDAHPLVEPVLRKNLVAQMPFPMIARSIFLWNHLGDTFAVLLHGGIIHRRACSGGIQAGHNCGAAWRTQRAGDIGVFKHVAGFSQSVHIRHDAGVPAIRGQRIGALLVREYKK